jgi:4-hydroxyphenylpyruvate dioxygenase
MFNQSLHQVPVKATAENMKYQPAILSASLGRAWLHNLYYKIEQAARAGFKGVEIFYEDLEYAAREISGNDTPSTEHILSAADRVHEACQAQGLEVISLQPFLFYEGLKDRDQQARLIEKMKLWLHIAKRLGTTTIQIPANFLPAEQLTDDLDAIASDLRQIADMGAAENPVVRFAYENLCWSTYIDTWEKLWEVVKRVDRPNFGMCLDTFNIAGRVWADPADPTGKTPNADADLKKSLERMMAEIDVAKVFYLQVVDAERMEAPLVPGHPFHVDGQPARMSWSRNARTFMYEKDRGAHLPVDDIARTIIHGLGYKGYVSMELFSRTMAEPGECVPEEHAARGIAAWKALQQELQLE